MPFRRPYRRRRRPYRRSRRSRWAPRRRLTRRVPRRFPRSDISFTQKTITQVIVQALPQIFTSFAGSYSLDQVNNYTSFTDIFDQYKINCIVQKISCIEGSNTAGNPGLIMYTLIDHDDATLPANAPEMLDNSKTRSHLITGNQPRTITRKLRPVPSSAYFGGGVLTATGYGPQYRPQWIDTRSPGVPHYGLKIGWDTSAAPLNTPMTFVLETNYYLSFKHIK